MASLGADGLRARFQQAITLHHGDPTPFVAVQLPILDLGNGPHCYSFSTLLAQGGRQWERRSATANLWEQLPDSPGLYMFVWLPELTLRVANGVGAAEWRLPCVLYIGQAGADESNNTLKNRYRGEYAKYVDGDPEQLWSQRGSERVPRRQLLQRYLTLFPLEYWYLEIDNASQVAQLEKRLLQMLNPPLVFQHRARLLGNPTPAF